MLSGRLWWMSDLLHGIIAHAGEMAKSVGAPVGYDLLRVIVARAVEQASAIAWWRAPGRSAGRSEAWLANAQAKACIRLRTLKRITTTATRIISGRSGM